MPGNGMHGLGDFHGERWADFAKQIASEANP